MAPANSGFNDPKQKQISVTETGVQTFPSKDQFSFDSNSSDYNSNDKEDSDNRDSAAYLFMAWKGMRIFWRCLV